MNHSTAPVVFQFDACRSVRIQNDEAGNPLFQANDLCSLLAYKNPHDAVRRHVETDDLVKREVIDARGRTQLANFVREPGMWALILGSETEQAKAVKRWVTSEVLPAIRKTGRFAKVGAGETAPSSHLTYEVMSKAVMSYAHQYGRDAALGVLRRFGSKNLPGVPESRWAELFAMLQYGPGNSASLQAAEERLRFSRFLLRFDPTSGQPQLSEVSKNASIIDPDNPSELQTFINEFVRFEQIPVVLQAAMNRINLCYQAVKDKAALPAPVTKPQARSTGRLWKDPEQAEELLKSMRFRLEEMYDFSLITPERVEELHKANVIGPRQMVKLKRLMAAS